MATQNLNFTIRVGYDDAAVGPGAARTESQLRAMVLEAERVARELAAAGAASQRAGGMIERLGTDASRAMDSLSRMGRQGSQVLRDLESAGRASANSVRATGQAADAFDRLGGSLARLSVGVVGVEALAHAMHGLVETARTMQDLEIRLRGVTEATGGFAEAESFLIKLSEQHHKTLSGLAEGYTQILSLEESGNVTRQEANRIMEGLSNAQSKYGVTNERIRDSLYGLGQALSSTTVQMDELHQITDPMPGLLAKMERAAGVAGGGFKVMAEQGQLSADLVKNSLIRVLDDMSGSAERTAGSLTAAANDIKREYELTAKTFEEPITLVVNVAADTAIATLRQLREMKLPSWMREWARGGYLPGASNVQMSPQESQFSDDQLGQIYQADTTRRMDRLFPGVGASANAPKTDGFTGPTIPDDVLKQRQHDADTLQDQYIKLLNGSQRYREALELEARQKNLSEAATATYVEQGLKLIAQKDQETSAHKTNKTELQANRESLQSATQAIEDNRKAQLRRIDALLKTADAEKRIELIGAGDNRSQQTEIEARYIENERVLNQERLQTEIAYDRQIIQTTVDLSDKARATRSLAEHQLELNGLTDDAEASLQRLRAAEQARGDAELARINNATADRQQLATLAERLATEGATADQIQRQVELKQRLLDAERKFPDRPDIQAAIQQEATANEQYQRVIDQAKQSADQYAELWKAAARRIDDTFQNLWEDLISGQNSVGGSLKRMLNSALAEVAHAAITKPLTGQLLQTLGVGSVTPGGSGDILSSILGKATSWLEGGTNAAAGAGAALVPINSAVTSGISTAITPGLDSLGNTLSAVSTGAGAASNALTQLTASTAAAGGTLPVATAGGLGSITGQAGINAITPTGLANVAPAAAGSATGFSFSSLGASNQLARLVTAGLGKIGVGSATAGIIGSGFANAGWGGIGSLLGNLMGFTGSNQIANIAFPAVGGIAGSMAGSALGGTAAGAMMGSWAGPIGAILGAFLGTIFSSLFNSTPKAFAAFRYDGGSGSMQTLESWRKNGGKLGPILQMGQSLYSPFRELEANLGVDLGTFNTRLYQRGNKLTVSGTDETGTFFDTRVKAKEKQINQAIDQFTVSILKRESVLKQFDSALIKGAVKLSGTTEQLQKNYESAQNIRAFIGDISENSTVLAGLTNKKITYNDEIIKFTADDSAARDRLLGKLSSSIEREFNSLNRNMRGELLQLEGRSNDAAKALANVRQTVELIATKDRELAQFAEKMGLVYTAISPERLAAAQATAEAALAESQMDSIKNLAGIAASASKAFGDLTASVDQLIRNARQLNTGVFPITQAALDAFSDVAAGLRQPIIDAQAVLTQALNEVGGKTVDTAAVMNDAVGKLNSINSTTSQSDGLAKIAAAQTAILANYQAQKNVADSLTRVYNNIADYSKSLIFSQNSIASPKDELDAAKQVYTTLIADIGKTTDPTKKTELLGQVTATADQYLKTLLEYYGPTARYNTEFNAVKTTLDSMVYTPGSYATDTTAALDKLKAPLETLNKAAETIISTEGKKFASGIELTAAQKQTLNDISNNRITYDATQSLNYFYNAIADASAAGKQTVVDTNGTTWVEIGGGNGSNAVPSGTATYPGTSTPSTGTSTPPTTTPVDTTGVSAGIKKLLNQINSTITDTKLTGNEDTANNAALQIELKNSTPLTTADIIAITAIKNTASSNQAYFAEQAGAQNIYNEASYSDPKFPLTNITVSLFYKNIVQGIEQLLAERQSEFMPVSATKSTKNPNGSAANEDTFTLLADHQAATNTELGKITKLLNSGGYISQRLYDLNDKLAPTGNLPKNVAAIQSNLSNSGWLHDGLGLIYDTINSGLGADGEIADRLENVNKNLGYLKTESITAISAVTGKLDTANTTLGKLETALGTSGTIATSITTTGAATVASLDGMANKFGAFGGAITTAFGALSTALSTGLTSVGTAVGATINDQAAQLKTAQDALTAATNKLQTPQTTTITGNAGTAGSASSSAPTGGASNSSGASNASAPTGGASGTTSNASAPTAPVPAPVTYTPPTIELSAPKIDTATAPPSQLYATAENPVVAATASGQRLIGTSALNETAQIPRTITGLSVSQNIEQVQLSNDLSAYKLAQAGNTLQITSAANGNLVATWVIPGKGGNISFTDAERLIKLSAGIMTVSGNGGFPYTLSTTAITARSAGGPVGPAYGGGLTLVGENGPELVRFNVPGQVYSNTKSQQILQADTTAQTQTVVAKLEKLIEMQANTIATLQLQTRNQTAEMADLRREIARQGGIARRAA